MRSRRTARSTCRNPRPKKESDTRGARRNAGSRTETLAINQEEADEIGFVPSALSGPRGVDSWCDNRCSEKALRYLQIASMVIEEGGEIRTINLCKLCYTDKLVQQGKQPLKSKGWKEVVEKKAHRGRPWKVFGSEQFLRGMCEYFILKGHGQGRHRGTQRRKIKNEDKVSGKKNFHSKKFWSSKKKCGYRLRCPDNAPCVQRNEAWHLGTFQ